MSKNKLFSLVIGIMLLSGQITFAYASSNFDGTWSGTDEDGKHLMKIVTLDGIAALIHKNKSWSSKPANFVGRVIKDNVLNVRFVGHREYEWDFEYDEEDDLLMATSYIDGEENNSLIVLERE